MNRRLALVFAFFAAVALGLLGAGHYYLWARLVRDAAWPSPVRAMATGVLVLAGSGVIVGLLLRQRSRRRFGDRLQTALFGWMGVGLLLVTALGLTDLARTVLGPRLGLPADVLASLPAGRLQATVAIAVGMSLSLAALRGGLRPPRLADVALTLPKLPAALSGLSIVQISDVHIGATLDGRFLDGIVDRVNALAPDLVAITGDLVDGPVERLGAQIEPLARLRARLGVFFVPGNHDHYAGLGPWLTRLEELGVQVLRNRSVVVDGGPCALAVAGIDDPTGRRLGDGGPDLDRALQGLPVGVPILLLSHQPSLFPAAARAGVALQLSGHTHGGQLFPFSLLVALFQRYLAGPYARGTSRLYVSRGTGFWGPPLRLGAPAEITRIVLAPAAQGGGATERIVPCEGSVT